MTRLFDETLVQTHDLYHVRYGRGAVIVAIRRDHGDTPDQDRAKQHMHVARTYNTRETGLAGSAPAFEPILSIQEEAGVVRIVVQFEHRSQRNPQYVLISATIERVIPLDQVTLEIVRTSEQPSNSDRDGPRHTRLRRTAPAS